MPQLDHLAAAIVHPLRRKILEDLRDGPKTQTALARTLPVAYNSTLKHLAMLERAGLVKRTLSGNQYSSELDAKPLEELIAWVSTLYPDVTRTDGVPTMRKPAEEQLRNAVEAFVNDISALVRQAVMEAVTQKLGGRGATRPGARRRPPRSRGTGAARPAPARPARA